MWILVAFFLGVIVGMIVSQIIFKPEIAGSLRIDRSDPDEKPYLFLECVSISSLQRRYVTFEVVEKNYISQK